MEPVVSEKSVRQLLKKLQTNVAKMSRSGLHADDITETLLGKLHILESTDSDFDRYRVVKRIRSKISTTLDQALHYELQPYLSDDLELEAPPDAAAIASRIAARPEFNDLQAQITKELRVVVDSIVQHYHLLHDATAMTAKRSSYHQSVAAEPPSPSSSSSSSSSSRSSLSEVMSIRGGSVNSDGVLSFSLDDLPPYHEIAKIVQNLQSDDLNARVQAMNMLDRFNAGDILSHEQWKDLREVLCESLSDNDPSIQFRSLSFLAKAFKEATEIFPALTGDIFNVLARHLTSIWRRGPGLVLAGDYLDLTSPPVVALIRKFRMLNSFARELPSYWFGFEDALAEETFLVAFTLLHSANASASNSPGHRMLLSGHLMAIVDPVAEWFQLWGVRTFFRKKLVRYMEQTGLAVELIRHVCLTRFSSTFTSVACNVNDLSYVLLLHSISMLGPLLIFEEGRHMLNSLDLSSISACTQRPCNVEWLLAKLTELLTTGLHAPHAWLTGKKRLVDVIGNILLKLAENQNASTVSGHILFSSALLWDASHLLLPIKHFLAQEGQRVQTSHGYTRGSCAFDILEIVADLLHITLNNPIGCVHMVLVKESRLESVIQLLVHMGRLLSEQGAELAKQNGKASLPIPANIFAKFLLLLKPLCRFSTGVQLANRFSLAPLLHSAWKNLVGESQQQWRDILLDGLGHFAWTSAGVRSLQEVQALPLVSQHIARQFVQAPLQAKDKSEFMFVLTLLASTKEAFDTFVQTGLLTHVNDLVRTILDPEGIEPLLEYLNTEKHTSRSRDHVKIGVEIAYRMFSSPHGIPYVVGLRSSDRDSIGSQVESLLTQVALCVSEESRMSLHYFDDCHQLGLRLLHAMSYTLDGKLWLEAHLNVTSRLLHMQQDQLLQPADCNGQCIISASTLLAQRIIHDFSCIRGAPDAGDTPPSPFGANILQNDNLPAVTIGKRSSTLHPLHKQPIRSQFDQFFAELTTESSQHLLPSCCLHNSVAPLLSHSLTYNGCNVNLATILAVKFETRALNKFEILGIQFVKKYAFARSLVSTASPVSQPETFTAALSRLIEHTDLRFDPTSLRRSSKSRRKSAKNRNKKSSEGREKKELAPGCLDWFLLSCFLVFQDYDQTLCFLDAFSSKLCSLFVWRRRGWIWSQQHGLPPESPLLLLCELIEGVVENELPELRLSLLQHNCPLAQIVLPWLSQCFWDVLDWPEVLSYVSLAIVKGADYQVYFCVALLAYMVEPIRKLSHVRDLFELLVSGDLVCRFNSQDHLEYMKFLEVRYRSHIERSMSWFNQQT